MCCIRLWRKYIARCQYIFCSSSGLPLRYVATSAYTTVLNIDNCVRSFTHVAAPLILTTDLVIRCIVALCCDILHGYTDSKSISIVILLLQSAST